MTDDAIKEAGRKMEASVDHTREEFATIRTGRANPKMFDTLMVEYYGTPTPLQQLATFQVPEARTILVTPYDRGTLGDIEKAIHNADLGVNPTNDGNIIRVVLPELTEERRRDLVKVVKSEAEGSRVAIRSVRRDANQDIKELAKEKLISADDEKRGEADIQKLTDQFVAKIDEVAAAKEKELMSM